MSCAQILAANPSATSGVYNIEPASSASFNAYCDMTDSGGGWTLALKVPGDTSVFDFSYDSSEWANGSVNRRRPDLTQNGALLPAYTTMPFTAIMVMMAAPGADGPSTQIVLPIADATSLQDLITSSAPNTVTTNLGRAAWVNLTTPAATVQAHCNAEGVNLTTSSSSHAAPQYARVRIGFLASSGSDCSAPDSYIGIGGETGTLDTSCAPSQPYSGPTAGSAGAVNCGGGADVSNFGYVFIR